ncbi:MAG: cysteine desulfurase [Oscillospiraceae bacterium]|nr:cysteine desulfurase [Oscillospiraceae bacterium]
MIYLDHAATAPVPPEVADAVRDTLVNCFGNPSSQYGIGREAKALVARCRETVAGALGCEAERLAFTSCGTESDNWVIRLAAHQGRHAGRHIITTAIEHSAVLEPCKQLEREGYSVTYLKPDKSGGITAAQVAEALREDTVLVSVMLVNNENGCILPIPEIAEALKNAGSAALLHTDAVQGFLNVPCCPHTLGADLVSISGHKVGAPKGVGALYLGARVKTPLPLLAGGGQEMGLRSGTEATAQLAGFAKAVELRQARLDTAPAHRSAVKAYALDKLLAIEGVERVGNGEAPHILAISLVGYPSANIVEDLGAQGICVSAGSACHRGRASHVYEAMGLSKKVKAGVLRLSFGPETRTSDIDALAEALIRHRDTRFPML